MFVSREKRRENVAEYILYLWQLEDLLRAMEFSTQRIYEKLVMPHTELDEQTHAQLLEWYTGMGELLESEGKSEIGHMEHTLHLIADLDDLHLHLLTAPAGKKYASIFAPLSEELPKLGEGSDMMRCFKALYSVMLCRMKGVENETYIKDVLELISPVVAELSHIYHKVERGDVDIYAVR